MQTAELQDQDLRRLSQEIERLNNVLEVRTKENLSFVAKLREAETTISGLGG